MYGSEVTWRGQAGMERTFQRSINRMARASLGVLPSTPVAFLQAEGGSLPARSRLEKRQAAFATRLASAPSGPHAEVVHGETGLGRRLRESLGQAAMATATVEGTVIGQGRTFPGQIVIPPVPGKEDKEDRIEAAIKDAKRQEHYQDTMWTDDSGLSEGGVGGPIIQKIRDLRIYAGGPYVK